MRYVLAVFLLAHGIAHVPGFAVPWRLMTSPEMPYGTTLVSGRFDVGAVGIRIVGVGWLAVGGLFVVGALGLIRNLSWAPMLLAWTIGASTLLSALNWPQARIGLVLNVILLAAMPFIGQTVWRDASAAAVHSLRGFSAPAPATFGRDCLDSLPAPVARYFRRALTDGQSIVTRAQIEQQGEFRVGESWSPFRAAQVFTTAPVGFVWDARIAVSPLMPVLVRDAYIAGSGSMRAQMLGLYSLANQSGRHELNAGALQRFLAEAVWFPTALLPGSNVSWLPIDDQAARATLVDGQTTVSLEFRFNQDGDVVEVFAPDRFAENHGRYEPKPWIVRCEDFETHAGMRIPVRCEVAWVGANGPEPYWRGRVIEARYNSNS